MVSLKKKLVILIFAYLLLFSYVELVFISFFLFIQNPFYFLVYFCMFIILLFIVRKKFNILHKLVRIFLGTLYFINFLNFSLFLKNLLFYSLINKQKNNIISITFIEFIMLICCYVVFDFQGFFFLLIFLNFRYFQAIKQKTNFKKLNKKVLQVNVVRTSKLILLFYFFLILFFISPIPSSLLFNTFLYTLLVLNYLFLINHVF